MNSGVKMDKAVVNIGESHAVAFHVASGHNLENWRERRGSNP